MPDINENLESPFLLKISFQKLLEQYEKMAKNKDEYLASKAKQILEVQQKNPILKEGFSDISFIEKYKDEIRFILQDVFSDVLTHNEIKTASVPFHNIIFNSSERFKSILKTAGKDFELKIKNMPEDDIYIIACTIILAFHYQRNLNFKRPFLYEIPDANGVMRYYKILYNADFVEIVPTKNAPKITDKDIDELLDNFNNISLWKKKFPLHSYVFKGFVIANIFDVTDDQSISNIKSNLIADSKRKDEKFMQNFHEIFQSLLGIKDLQVGFSIYNKEEDIFERVYGEGIQSFLLNEADSENCINSLCKMSYKKLLVEKEFYAISDVDKFYELSKGKAPQMKILKEQGIKSAILAPIADGEELLGILEIVSPQPKVLNSINANKLIDVMPFIVSSVVRSKKEEENLIEAVIQQECTSIHPSVYWKFNRAARKFIKDQHQFGNEATFSKIVFENVYPLFGQIDVKGSSDARNLAIQKDLSLQLSMIEKILDSVIEIESLPIYKQLKYQVNNYVEDLKNDFKVDSEQQITNFLKDEIEPLFKFQLQKNPKLKSEIDDYFSKIDDSLNVIYYYRKNYDDTITLINKNMSSVLDTKQAEAQKMYPHYFERYKTDGVEHNMYIGESIAKGHEFNDIYLHNLKLWQLQVMCEMENEFYKNQHEYPVSMDVTSMILVFNQPISIRFRMDEKQFDVDGTYNARYEVVKKRVDKANIKGTDERLTQKGKIAIVFSQKEDEIEYLQYVKFLQHKNVLNDEVEILELQDLQGITGLKAIRVGLLYSSDNDKKEFYTYDDLMKEIKQ